MINILWVSIDIETCLGVVYLLPVDTLRIDGDSLQGTVQFLTNYRPALTLLDETWVIVSSRAIPMWKPLTLSV
jgi:hypothetical protein